MILPNSGVAKKNKKKTTRGCSLKFMKIDLANQETGFSLVIITICDIHHKIPT